MTQQRPARALEFGVPSLRGPIQHFFAWQLVTAIAVLWPAAHEPGGIGLAFGLALLCAGCASLSSVTTGVARLTTGALYLSIALPSFVAMVALGLYLNLRGQPGQDAVRAMAQTNFAEALDYLASLMSAPAAVTAITAALAIASTFPSRKEALPRGNLSLWFGLMSLVAAALLLRSAVPEFFGPMYAYVAKYKQETAVFQQLLEKRRTSPIVAASTEMRGTIIVVIGESTARHHMQLYGYFRPTTPRLAALDRDVVAFGDVISPHSHTVPALMSALTSSGSSQQEDYFEANSVDFVSLAKSAGIKTYWLSNQNEFGLWDNAVSIVAKAAHETHFFSNTIGRTLRRSVGDHEMVPAVRELMGQRDSAPRVIFVHLFAAHSPYCANHPGATDTNWKQLGPEFYGPRSERSDVGCYDSSMRYVDGIVADLAQATLDAGEPVALLFFSDHGEAPLLGTGHESSKHSSYHLEVPFLLVANHAFRQQRPELWDAARANRMRPYSTSRLYHTLADLAAISHQSVDLSNSPFNASFVEQDRFALNGSINYDRWAKANDYRVNARVGILAIGPLRSRVWAHRVNTLGMLLEAKAVFDGIESDVVFEPGCGCFHVYHPPAEDVGLRLEQVLEATQDRPQLKLWLDWKNATPENISAAVSELTRLDGRYSIKSRALIETGSDATFAAVAQISEAGFRSGYYLPTNAVRAALRQRDEALQRALAAQIVKTVTENRFSAITFDWRLEPFVAKWLDPMVIERGLGSYSWDMSISPSQLGAPEAIEKRFRTRMLDGLLVTFPSDFRR